MCFKKVMVGITVMLSTVMPVFAQPLSENNPEKLIHHNAYDIKVSINTATAEELSKKLKGIGVRKAQRIIEYRERYGAFSNVDQLMEVPGIGLSTLEYNRAKLKL